MNRMIVGTVALVLASLLGGCGGTDNTPVGQSKQDLAATPGPIPVDPKCPPGQKICRVEEPNGACADQCVPDNVLCVAPPVCRVTCDPPGPPPRPVCQWNLQTCQWDCPVCDPAGPPPRSVCHWDLETCEWVCPVCDPYGRPPFPICVWNTQLCTWVC